MTTSVLLFSFQTQVRRDVASIVAKYEWLTINEHIPRLSFCYWFCQEINIFSMHLANAVFCAVFEKKETMQLCMCYASLCTLVFMFVPILSFPKTHYWISHIYVTCLYMSRCVHGVSITKLMFIHQETLKIC